MEAFPWRSSSAISDSFLTFLMISGSRGLGHVESLPDDIQSANRLKRLMSMPSKLEIRGAMAGNLV